MVCLWCGTCRAWDGESGESLQVVVWAWSLLWWLQHWLLCVEGHDVFGREQWKWLVSKPLRRRGRRPFDGSQSAVEVQVTHGRRGRLQVLKVEEVLDVLLRVAFVDLLQHGFVQCKGRELVGVEDVRGCYHRGNDFGVRLVKLFGLPFDISRHDIHCRVGVAGIAVDEDAAALGRADREATDAVLCMQELELSLLLSPFGAVLSLITGVRFGEELFDRND